MNDRDTGRDLARRMAAGTLLNEEFRHRQHLELAYYYLVRHDYDVALRLMASSIRDFATANGHAGKFHATLTGCWIRFVAAALSAQDPCPSFDELLVAHPELLSKDLPLSYYSEPLLHGPQARESLVEPDVRALPAIAELVH